MRLDLCEAAIKEKKDEMIKLGMTKGLQNEETIYCSQELDKLLNEYNRLLADNNQSKPINHHDDFYSLFRDHILRILSLPYRYFLI
ncbi:aspartyl-phosphate phosphatase Spo0E family protein [Neobacillus sp. MER 74]|uniref:aspartyl-phosphate phosphatase Spo0E family protein n=1 Tax=Neobacillus sp. MER 74 TaxID=2939566 RepID=UPI0020425CE1|nr:aspartyl-phosphate phosphatase Spo0E family protein [Neobacillus sp. MER 74]MCM3117543.1 aspartyl-phosphate phosphatase Spo0E family protein [Neobacillus sp. MER 74]